MRELWRDVRSLQHLDGPGGIAGVKQQFRKRDRRDPVAGVFVDERLAHGPCTRRLSVPHEHPCGRKQKLSLVGFHLAYCCDGGVSRKIVTMIFS